MKKAKQIKGNEAVDFTIEHEQKNSLRLNKYISSSGFCSRREADRYIEEGKVMIDGEVAPLGMRVFSDQIVEVDGHRIRQERKIVYIALHKPVGITCTTDTSIEGNIADFMNYTDMIFPIGRLDKDSSGLILLTNDGDVVNKILRSSNHHEKEYIVHVNKLVSEEFVQKMKAGVKIYNPVNNTYQTTKIAKVSNVGKRSFHLVLSEGLNRQIRRMCKALGYRVQNLVRIRVMNISLEDLKVGEWRYLTETELKVLNANLKDSKS